MISAATPLTAMSRRPLIRMYLKQLCQLAEATDDEAGRCVKANSWYRTGTSSLNISAGCRSGGHASQDRCYVVEPHNGEPQHEQEHFVNCPVFGRGYAEVLTIS
jgi:hypothetical protein